MNVALQAQSRHTRQHTRTNTIAPRAWTRALLPSLHPLESDLAQKSEKTLPLVKGDHLHEIHILFKRRPLRLHLPSGLYPNKPNINHFKLDLLLILPQIPLKTSMCQDRHPCHKRLALLPQRPVKSLQSRVDSKGD
jgi:hypothetical protein